MGSPSNITEARNAALRKIGRNVVNFQKMEGMLKLLNAECNVTGPASEFSKIRSQASRSVAKQPMGRLADAFVKSVYSEKSDLDEIPQDSDEVWISTSFMIDSIGEIAKERQKALSAVVEERNKLIHQWLSVFDFNSVESCKELSTLLDDQHAKVWPEFEILRSMVCALREYREYFLQQLALGDFELELETESTGS